ncbi:MAG: hypothetical protein HDR06_18740 [Lachnospiraceae bacterium]|nr:hypothetical protein [Lachnospiraceae bacterium]
MYFWSVGKDITEGKADSKGENKMIPQVEEQLVVWFKQKYKKGYL